MKIPAKIPMKNLNFDSLFFVIAHWVCRVLAVAALLTSIFALFGVLSTFSDNDFSVPRFGEEDREQASKKKTLWGGLPGLLDLESEFDIGSVEEGDYVQITKKYIDDVNNIIKKHKFGETSENDKYIKRVLELLQRIPENRRNIYVSGWDAFLKDGLADLEGRGKTADSPGQLTMQYNAHFHRALGEAKKNEQRRYNERLFFAGIFLGGLLLLVLVVIVPILLAIERNTRQARSGATQAGPSALPVFRSPASPVEPTLSAPPETVASVASCPKCAAPVTPNDAFCGECGAALN